MRFRVLLGAAGVLALLAGSLSVAGTSTRAASSPFISLLSTQQVLDGYTPAQLETAYNVTPLITRGINGAGQTIALIELDKFNPSDIQGFDTAENLPAPSIQQFYVGGTAFHLSNQGETTMDLEWAHALAPGAKLQVYYLNGSQSTKAGWKSVAAAAAEAARNGATQISISFGACAPKASDGYSVTKNEFATLLKQGVSTFVSSGDSGPFTGPPSQCGRQVGVSYPASDPSVVAVGGTSLDLNADNSIADESAWHLSGGGKGNPLLHPLWQIIAQLPHPKYRWAPDVSFLADPQTGAAMYYKGRWGTAGGTSLGAPAWAAIWSVIRQDAQQAGKTVPAAPPEIYNIANTSAYSQAFNDVTSGNNGLYRASTGWDPVTGWGTPNVAGLAAAVTGSPAPGSTGAATP